MDKSRDYKSTQLGINYGTANARLQRMILFKLVRQTNQHYCYRCGSEIETIDDFSIEHKKPWLHRDTALYWDLDNIAFSHRICNSSHTERILPRPRTKVSDDPNKSWCYNCQRFLDKNQFTRNKHQWDGLEAECITCRKLRRSGTVV